MVNKYIFLDIDGVLLTTEFRKTPSPLAITALNKITEKTGAGIVVSSSWRKAGFDSVKNTLRGWGVIGRIVGITPDLSVKNEDTGIWTSVQRGEEIQAWLDRCDPTARFVILDDETDTAHLAPFLVRTYYTPGLCHVHALTAISILQAQ